MRAFFKQIRIETGLRVCAKVYEELGDKPSKVIFASETLYLFIFGKRTLCDTIETITNTGANVKQYWK